MAAVYFVFMMAGAFAYRVPPAGWVPEDGFLQLLSQKMQ